MTLNANRDDGDVGMMSGGRQRKDRQELFVCRVCKGGESQSDVNQWRGGRNRRGRTSQWEDVPALASNVLKVEAVLLKKLSKTSALVVSGENVSVAADE